MISVEFDKGGLFKKQMQNLIDYSLGFVEGIEKGKTEFLKNLGEGVQEIIYDFIDASARVDSRSLHHVYEWYRTGSPDARLYNISYTVSHLGLSIKSNFSQSSSVANGSSTPFYDKAKVMESGMSISISPRRSRFLKFESGGESVFTPNEVLVSSAGGESTNGAFEKVFDSFFKNYFQQSFIQSSGLRRGFEDPSVYRKNLAAGMSGGKSVGVATGQRWIANVRIDSK